MALVTRAAAFVALAALLAYWTALRGALRACDDARAASRARLTALEADAYAAYTECAWDAVPGVSCGLAPRAAAAATVASPADTVRSALQRPAHARHTDTPESAWCAALRALPAVPFAEAAVAAADEDDHGRVAVVVSRDRLTAFDETLVRFRRQCDCGWVWPFRTPANYDYKVAYEFLRSGLGAAELADELRRAPAFYALLGGGVDTWVASVAGAPRTHLMSDHGALFRATARYASVIVRYILVVYTPAAAASSSSSSDDGGGAGSDSGWFVRLRGGGGGAGGGGTFMVAMSEVQITAWPAADCDCVHEPALQERMRDTIDARMKKHFADTAAHLIRAVPDALLASSPPPPAAPVVYTDTRVCISAHSLAHVLGLSRPGISCSFSHRVSK